MAIADNIKKVRERYGLSQVELAEIAGVTDKAVSTWENGINEPRMGAIQKIADHFGLLKSNIIEDGGMDSVLNAFSHPSIIPINEMRSIPMLGLAPCGTPIVAIEEHEQVQIPAWMKADFAVTAIGDSMVNAGIEEGDIVLCMEQPVVENKQIAVIMNADEVTLKRFHQQGKTAFLLPENPAYDPIVIDLENNDSIRILGRAVNVLKDLK